MRRLILAATLGLVLYSSAGCLLPIYSGDPAVRTQELINTSEDFRNILEEWRRIWFTDQPSHLAPLRVHGGVV